MKKEEPKEIQLSSDEIQRYKDDIIRIKEVLLKDRDKIEHLCLFATECSNTELKDIENYFTLKHLLPILRDLVRKPVLYESKEVFAKYVDEEGEE